MKLKITELMNELRAQNKLTELTPDECKQIDEHIRSQMIPFRRELAVKQVQSIRDAQEIILNT